MLRSLLCTIARFALKLRYRIEVQGLDKVIPLAKKGGILVLPNHPSQLDPLIIFSLLDAKFHLRPLVVDFIFDVPFVGWLLRSIAQALAVPNFDLGGNEYTKSLAQKALTEVIAALKKGKNIMLYPSGRLKMGPSEELGGASGLFQILLEAKETPLVLVRTSGLWGSSFSRAQTGGSPDLGLTLLRALGLIASNLIFFMPRRKVLVEFEHVTLPPFSNKIELNAALQEWYNKPFEEKGEPLVLVREYFWSSKLPKIKAKKAKKSRSLRDIPSQVQEAVQQEIARLAKVPKEKVMPHTHLAKDLGLDSLDLMELVTFLDEHFETVGVQPAKLEEVLDVYFAAAFPNVDEEGEEIAKASLWPKELKRPSPQFCDGLTLQEVFLRTCDKWATFSACSDDIGSIWSYRKLKRVALLLSRRIALLDHDQIGIMMPACTAATLLVMATLLARKRPVMLNWTLGAKNLCDISGDAKLTVIITSERFLKQAKIMDVRGVEGKLLPLEKLAIDIMLSEKIRAFVDSLRGTDALLRRLKLNHLQEDDTAALLFTSGTESKPKGVPLSHKNFLSNQRAAVSCFVFSSQETLFGFLPPFHSFGFSITLLLPLFCGLRVVYSPDPTDSLRLARSIQRWRATLLLAAPTFLTGLFKVVRPGQLDTLRLVVCGAEKAPPALFSAVRALPKAELLEGYGITECSPILTLNRSGRPPCGVGNPLPGVELSIVDPVHQRPLPVGKEGLILAYGPNIFSGYLQPALASPFFEENHKRWYITGDIGYLNENGALILSGRLKRFVKMGGEMISLMGVEEALQSVAEKHRWPVTDAGPSLAVCAKEVEGDRPQLILYSTFDLSVEEANEALKEIGYSPLVKITTTHRLNAIPLLGTGKTNYRALETLPR